MKDYYKVLGIAPGAPTEVVKAAYRALMKIHHPDVGGDPQRAKEIEEAFRHLAAQTRPAREAAEKSNVEPPTPVRKRSDSIVVAGKYIETAVFELSGNRVFSCPRECTFYRRKCRFKQILSVESEDLLTFKATTLDIQVRNLTDSPQVVDFRHGRGVLVDQMGDFYQCHQVCTYQHPAKYKEAVVELFAGTQANIMLWFQQQPPGRYVTRLVYKHRALVSGMRGDYWDQEILDINLTAKGKLYLRGKK